MILEEKAVFDSLAKKGIAPDAMQRAAVAAILHLINARPRSMHGVYCWGPPGRGKSAVVDTIFALAPCTKLRVHFHAFMRDTIRRQVDAVADGLDGIELLCFDEFHVHDIADAFLVGRFLDAALARGIRVVLTSNYAPQALLPDPQFHDRFAPTIARIERDFTVVQFDGARDYRLGAEHTGTPAFYALPDAAALLRHFRAAEDQAPQAGAVTLAGRTLPVRGAGTHLVWADFADLCIARRSHLDYLALAERWQGLIVDRFHVADLASANTLQRFIWLVDILYDQQRALVIASDAPLLAAIRDSDGAHDVGRLVSRLTEMQWWQPIPEPVSQAPER
jgi:cell division protein ZapE